MLRRWIFHDFLLFSNEIPTVGTKGNVMISREILENRPPRIEIDLSRSSRGVQKCSWALQIVIRVCWIDCARFWNRRSDPNMISRSTIFFFVKMSHTPEFWAATWWNPLTVVIIITIPVKHRCPQTNNCTVPRKVTKGRHLCYSRYRSYCLFLAIIWTQNSKLPR